MCLFTTDKHSDDQPLDENANDAALGLPSEVFSEEESEMYLSTDEDDLFKLLDNDLDAKDFGNDET